MTEEELIELPLQTYINAKKAIELHNKSKQDFYLGPRKCLWIWGLPRIGKSRACRELNPYIKNLNKWWDGYSNEETVLIDEFCPETMSYLAYYLKIWGDSHGKVRGEIKGSSRPLQYRTLLITSNYSIAQCVPPHDTNLLAALKARYREIHMQPEEYKEGLILEYLDD